MSGEEVLIPDDQAFNKFKSECILDGGWNQTYSKSGITVLIQILEEEKSLHKIKVGEPLWSLHKVPQPSDVHHGIQVVTRN